MGWGERPGGQGRRLSNLGSFWPGSLPPFGPFPSSLKSYFFLLTLPQEITSSARRRPLLAGRGTGGGGVGDLESLENSGGFFHSGRFPHTHSHLSPRPTQVSLEGLGKRRLELRNGLGPTEPLIHQV
jgi:hypothetical protein